MIPPVRREALRERQAQDEADEMSEHARETLSDRLAMAVELSELTRALADAVGAPWVTEPADDLEDRARLWAAPLRALVGS